MDRGSLIIYDNNGKIWVNTGDATGDVLPHEVPVGLPYILTEYGALNNKRVLSVDVVNRTLITEDLPHQVTYEELQQQLLQAQGVI
jgi:hypothetical protein